MFGSWSDGSASAYGLLIYSSLVVRALVANVVAAEAISLSLC